MFSDIFWTLVASLAVASAAAPGHETPEDDVVPNNLRGPKLLDYNNVNSTLIYVSTTLFMILVKKPPHSTSWENV